MKQSISLSGLVAITMAMMPLQSQSSEKDERSRLEFEVPQLEPFEDRIFDERDFALGMTFSFLESLNIANEQTFQVEYDISTSNPTQITFSSFRFNHSSYKQALFKHKERTQISSTRDYFLKAYQNGEFELGPHWRRTKTFPMNGGTGFRGENEMLLGEGRYRGFYLGLGVQQFRSINDVNFLDHNVKQPYIEFGYKTQITFSELFK